MIKSNRKPRVKVEISRNRNTEQIVSRNLLGNFNFQTAKSSKIIESIVKMPITEVKKDHLLEFAKILSIQTGENIPRNYSRTKPLIIKWIDLHLDEFIDLAPRLSAE